MNWIWEKGSENMYHEDRIKSEIFTFLPLWITDAISKLSKNQFNSLMEIRLRINSPVALRLSSEMLFIGRKSCIVKTINNDIPKVTQNEVWDIFKKISFYSFHTYENQIKEGFITTNGGHRIGISGDFQYDDESFGVRDITSLNIRIAREAIGCGEELVNSIFIDSLSGVLIVSPPSCGKTTILRDISRILSNGINGKHYNVSMIDERGELSGYCKNKSVFDIGSCTDLMLSTEKSKGILRALRTLSPDVIICDEAGSRDEVKALAEGFSGGVTIITTAHAGSEYDIHTRTVIKELLNSGAFRYVVMLKKSLAPGEIEWIKEVQMNNEINDFGNNFSLHSTDWDWEGKKATTKSKRNRENDTLSYISF